MTTSWMPYLTLAAERAGVPVQLAPARDHSFKLDVSSIGEEMPEDAELSFLEVSPRLPTSVGLFMSQARLEVDVTAKTVRILLKRFGGDSVGRWPLSLRGTVPQHREDGMTFIAVSISLRWPLVTISDLEVLHQLSLIYQESDAEVQILDDATGATLSSPVSTWARKLVKYLPDWATQDVLDSLLTVNAALPVPVLISGEVLGDRTLARDRWPSSWGALIEECGKAKAAVTSVSFAFTDSEENLQYEEFLCFRPGRLIPVLTTERGKARGQRGERSNRRERG